MGSQFSMGVYPELLLPFTSMDMEALRRTYTKFCRMVGAEYENDGFFMTRKQFQDLFVEGDEGEDDQDDAVSAASYAFQVFSFFDPQQAGVAVATDIWGALALSSSAKEEAKLSFLFDLADANNDKYLNATELMMVIHSASRGFSRMKEIEAPDSERVEAIVESCFAHPEVREEGSTREEGSIQAYKHSGGSEERELLTCRVPRFCVFSGSCARGTKGLSSLCLSLS